MAGSGKPAPPIHFSKPSLFTIHFFSPLSSVSICKEQAFFSHPSEFFLCSDRDTSYDSKIEQKIHESNDHGSIRGASEGIRSGWSGKEDRKQKKNKNKSKMDASSIQSSNEKLLHP
ncbi:hypothetical protein MCOR25_009805 [Pyricularia grisea]|nr:hypothetical protein MCOR25_009805 [Pyricularia grisea]